MKRTVLFVGIGLALLAALAPSAAADPFNAYEGTLTTGVNGNGKGRQTFKNFTLGLDFTAAKPIKISRVAVWDDSFTVGLQNPHVVAFWDLADTSSPIATFIVPAGTGGSLEDGYRYYNINPFIIAEGTDFVATVHYPEDNLDSNGNGGRVDQFPPDYDPYPIFDDGNGTLINNGSARYGFGDGFPTIIDTGPENRYHSISFTYSPMPEPGTLALLSGAAAVAAVRRRRRRKQDA